jgi:hypothetical protein
MAGPIKFNILDGQLGQLPATIANAIVHAGICANGVPNQMYGLGNPTTAAATLGAGPLTEDAADTINVAGACYAVPINPSVAGSIPAFTHLGTGAGTITPTLAPAQQILVKIITGGALGTMTASFSVGGGAYSAPVTSTASWAYRVPGTLTVLSFATQTYTSGDVWTITTAGVITVVGAGTSSWVTQASSPMDAYDVFIGITTAGATGTAQMTVSVDGQAGNSKIGPIVIPSGNVYVIPGTGIVLTFASTFVATDTYESIAVPAGFSGGDVSAMLTAVGNSPNTFVGLHIVGAAASSAAAVSLAATIDTSLTAYATAYRFIFAMVENPQSESDATIEAAWNAFSSNRIMVTCADVLHISSLSGNIIRRNCGVTIASRLASVSASIDPGWVNGGKLANIAPATTTQTWFRNEANTPGLVPNRITTITTQPTKGQTIFSSTGVMMASIGSDYASIMNRRVMDVACTTTTAAVIGNVNEDLLANKDGTIFDPQATKIEQYVQSQLATALLTKKAPTNRPDASAVSANIDRTENILATGDYSITIGITPKGYAHSINVTIGFTNPALA